MELTSGEEILDLLFDKEDPLLKEVDYIKNFDNQESSLQQNDWEFNDKTLWNTILKEEKDDNLLNFFESDVFDMVDYNEDDMSGSVTSSPHSTSTSSENCTVNNVVVEEILVPNSSTMDVVQNSSVFNPSQFFSSTNVSETDFTVMEIGADVEIITSEVENNFVCKKKNKRVTPEPKSVKQRCGRKKCRRSTDSDNSLNSFSLMGPEILCLTQEEKKLMEKEGVYIPTDMPLTREELRELKRIRRKIRNKIAAQESRKRKKEYVDELEERVRLTSSQNAQLRSKVSSMEKHIKNLLEKVKELQFQLFGNENSFQTSTFLMVLLVSFTLLILPSLLPDSLQAKELFHHKDKMPPVGGRSRSLLFADTSDGNEIEIEHKENMSDAIPKESKDEFRYEEAFPSFHDSESDHDMYTKAFVPRMYADVKQEPPSDDSWHTVVLQQDLYTTGIQESGGLKIRNASDLSRKKVYKVEK